MKVVWNVAILFLMILFLVVLIRGNKIDSYVGGIAENTQVTIHGCFAEAYLPGLFFSGFLIGYEICIIWKKLYPDKKEE